LLRYILTLANPNQAFVNFGSILVAFFYKLFPYLFKASIYQDLGQFEKNHRV